MTSEYILLVEDNEDDVELTKRALRDGNITNPVLVARDGEEALAMLLDDSRAPPVLVLLDLMLPKLDGHDVLKAVRAHERTRLLPVVVLTSSVHEEDLVRSYALGANSYVRKPVDFDEFLAAARQLGVYWLVLNQPAPPPARSPA